ncbi:tRNA dihydrouridine(20/20a) synthase DusA [Candidatus Liberibacter americanus]|uniref:tRNA-dihydrouridine synthase n=1 Tax=Candidatus Liberibacter americanus str. Sao Paulo TaxID=1261131 RepID=U6B4U6_9HYPH|nr:tRNA dihydrouridine(20/20a) synthase DusA [Candidatus Liberibacter americanus]AHA28089.1 tRNA-dihydrouridine synthase A [Candidatus Liberibacter americanus str. Sao Paulo]EMS36063.1 tRNA-dihydrouridine synthase A [Candidatus Liberibacter americanus PW_SP]
MFAYTLKEKSSDKNDSSCLLQKVFAVAPMVDWTDRHYRFLARLLTKNALLYTEMIVDNAIIHGDKQNLLSFSHEEKPLAIQIGGMDISKLVKAASIAEDFGYNEINFNIGCPSPRVKSGSFGACMMLEPDYVGECIAEMKYAVSIPVTVKCRIGVDDQIPAIAIRNLIRSIKKSGVNAVWIHARKALLNGLSTSENRHIPDLDYELVYAIKKENPDLFIGINGGIDNIQQAIDILPKVDGVMLGRVSYQNSRILTSVDEYFSNPLTGKSSSSPIIVDKEFWRNVSNNMSVYAERYISAGGKLGHITRHMIGLFQGFPNARLCRHILAVEANQSTSTHKIIEKAFNIMIESLD